jgi:hypothetical protein
MLWGLAGTLCSSVAAGLLKPAGVSTHPDSGASKDG